MSVTELKAFWMKPGYWPMSDEAIADLCNGDATEDIFYLRGNTWLIRVTDHQGEKC